MSKISAAGFILGFICIAAGCNNSPEIIITDTDGRPVEGAVIFGTSLSIRGQKTRSDSRGFAKIPRSVQKTKWISVEKAGYITITKIDVDKEKPIRIILQKSETDSAKVLFSEVSGRLLHNGRAVKNQEVRQTFTWLGVDQGEASTRTDKHGYYSFPAITSTKDQPEGEDDIFIMQTIGTDYKDQSYTLWQTTKYDFLNRGELGGHPIRMVNELNDESRNYMLPTFGEYRTNLDGVLELDHPYVKETELGRKLIEKNRKKFEDQLLEKLNSPELLKQLNSSFTNPILQPYEIEAITELAGMKISDYSPCTDSLCSDVSLEKNSYIGFTLACRALVRLSTGKLYYTDLYWPKASASLEPEAEFELEGNYTELSIDNRELLKEGLAGFLDTEQMAELLEEIITTSPDEGTAYILDSRLSMADFIYDHKELPADYKPGYKLEALSVSRLSPSHVNTEEDYASVNAVGKLSVAGHPNTYSFSAWICLSLRSLNTGDYVPVRNEKCSVQFNIPVFSFDIEMTKPEFRKDEPLMMSFTVTNLLPKENIFLKWHTPFEGFRNEFLEVMHMESGTGIRYEGILASRAAPQKGDGSYIEFAAGASENTGIDLRKAYTFEKKGLYQVFFSGYSTEGQKASTEFNLK